MLAVDDHGLVRVLRIDRPDKRNAIDAATAAGLADALDEAIDDGVRCLVLTGTGSAFSAGVDLQYLTAITQGEADAEPMKRFNRTLRILPIPVIVAVNGVAVGVGTTLCLHADLVIAAASARFRTPFSELGVAPELGSSWLLPQQVGHQAAAWMLLSSDWIDAPDAMARGLVFEVVPDDELIGRAIKRASVIAERDPEAVQAAKRTVQAWRLPAIAAAVEVENGEFEALIRRT
ncbi:MAG: enoyl-CoA hydratase/isomerase family protein [Acidimicrobiales bacterium]